MKLIKAIKLHRSLRIRQEVLCDECCKWSQDQYLSGYNWTPFPKLKEYGSVNRAVNNVENKLPWIYFPLSDLFGGASSIKKQANVILDW
jgi:hypothetical protein